MLLKECIDVQLRCGINVSSDLITTDIEVTNDPEAAISDRLVCSHRHFCTLVHCWLFYDSTDNLFSQLTFSDINGLVEQNVKLRSLVRKLSEEVEDREIEMKV